MFVRGGLHVCVLGSAFLYDKCVRVGVHVCVLGWAIMYLCLGGSSCMFVRVGIHVCVRVGVHVG
jgi:hypothetical protein